MGIFPSDHLIQNQNLFEEAIRLGIECAQKKQVVTIGLQPTFASTGYGYIEVKNDTFLTKNKLSAFTTKGFREKPNEETAKSFIAAGTFFLERRHV